MSLERSKLQNARVRVCSAAAYGVESPQEPMVRHCFADVKCSTTSQNCSADRPYGVDNLPCEMN